VRSVWGPPLTCRSGSGDGARRSEPGRARPACCSRSRRPPTHVAFDTERDLPRREGAPRRRLGPVGSGPRLWDPHRGTRAVTGTTSLGHAVLAPRSTGDTPRDWSCAVRAPVDGSPVRPSVARWRGRSRDDRSAEVLPESRRSRSRRTDRGRARRRGGSCRSPDAGLAALGRPDTWPPTGRPPGAGRDRLAGGVPAPGGPGAHRPPAGRGRRPRPAPRSWWRRPRRSWSRDEAGGWSGWPGTRSAAPMWSAPRPGDGPQAHLLGGLLRDAGLANVLDRVGRVPADTRAVLVVEGGTDEAYLRLAADRLGRREVLEGRGDLPSAGRWARRSTRSCCAPRSRSGRGAARPRRRGSAGARHAGLAVRLRPGRARS
jgi:hypothetical protein